MAAQREKLCCARHKSSGDAMPSFRVEDCDRPRDLGIARLLLERTAIMTAGKAALHPQHRCAMLTFRPTDDRGELRMINYLIATLYCNEMVCDLKRGEHFDSKVTGGFPSRYEAEMAFRLYGTEYLAGPRMPWSLFTVL